MKTIKQYVKFALPVIAAVAFLLTSCSGLKDKEAQVPSNAILVAHMNVNSIWQKAELNNPDNLQTYTLLREGLGEAMPKLEQLITNLLKDPSTTGIDTGKDVVFFAATKGNSIMSVTGAFEASLKDKESFTNFLNNVADVAGEKLAIEEGDLSYLSLDKNVVMAYNNKSVVIVAGMQADSLKDYAKHLFELDGSEALTSNEHYKTYLDNRQDEGLFLPLCNWFGEKGFLNDPTIKALMQQSGSQFSNDQVAMLAKISCYFTTSFENGAIVTTLKTLGLDDQYKGALGKGIDNSLMAFMPEQTLAALSLSVNMPAVLKILESDKSYFESIDQQFQSAGLDFTAKDIFEMIGGNLVASFYGLGKDNTPLLAAACDINKADIINKFIDLCGLKGKNNLYDLGNNWTLFFDGKTLAITNAATAKAYATGGFQNSCAPVTDKVRKGNYLYLDLNVQHYPQSLLDLLGYKAGNDATLDQVLALFDCLELVTVDETTAVCTLKLNDQRNALAAILGTADAVAMAFLNTSLDDDEALALED